MLYSENCEYKFFGGQGGKGSTLRQNKDGRRQRERDRSRDSKCEGDQRGREEPGSLARQNHCDPCLKEVRGWRKHRDGQRGQAVACCVGTAVVTQMPAGPQAGVDGLRGCLSGSGLGSDASGPWLLVGPDALASSRFRPLGRGLDLGNQCCIFRAEPPSPFQDFPGSRGHWAGSTAAAKTNHPRDL